MITLPCVPAIPPVFQYAETHYRFPFFFSLLAAPAPEVVADAPWFITPGSPIPLLVIAKDANRYPFRLHRVRARAFAGDLPPVEQEWTGTPEHVRAPLWWRLFEIPHPGYSGWIDVQVEVHVEIKGRVEIVRTDNYRTTSHRPLQVYLARQALPAWDSVFYGDAHIHSSYTSDQVEFGAPLEPAGVLSRASGLSFFCVTDHSYDLDDSENDYLAQDPRLEKWNALHREVDLLNGSTKEFAIIRGEEVTCRNHRERNVHLLLLGNRVFVPGSGDGAERWLRTRSEHTIADAIGEAGNFVYAFSAHPFESPSLLQRILLRRDCWHDVDMSAAGLTGMQVANGSLDLGPRSALKRWTRLLLRGLRLTVLAGNDAHGNFNRFRQIQIPFVKLREDRSQLFGGVKTGIVDTQCLGERELLQSLGAGSCFVTDGPACFLTATDAQGKIHGMGKTVRGDVVTLRVTGISSEDFGPVRALRLWQGSFGAAEEVLVRNVNAESGFRAELAVEYRPPSAGYVRAEVETAEDNPLDRRSHVAATNPIWVEPR